MARTPRTVVIGPNGYQAICPVPRERIGFWEALGLTLRGRIDARRTREVRDTESTHTLHRLMAAHRRGEGEATRRIDEALSAVDRVLAPLEALVAAPVPEEQPVPGSAELAALPEEERAEWAARVRAAHAAEAVRRSVLARRSAAEPEVAVLHATRYALAVEGEDVRRQWREAYAMRAARYTRARFGRSGGAMAETPAIPDYRHFEPPTVHRRV